MIQWDELEFKCKIKQGQLVDGALPDALLRFSDAVLKDLPEGEIWAVKLRSSDNLEHRYAALLMRKPINHGDLVVLGTARPNELMEVKRERDCWMFYPVDGPDRHPYGSDDLVPVLGKVVK